MAIFLGNGGVWNPKRGKVTIRFSNEKYETFDEEEIKLLRQNKFKELFIENKKEENTPKEPLTEELNSEDLITIQEPDSLEGFKPRKSRKKKEE